MKISISKSNKKMCGIPSFSFPPVVTCSNCAECKRKCYALRMAKFRPSIMEAWRGNLEAWNENREAVKHRIMSEAFLTRYFRYFVGGDIPDFGFLCMMAEVAEAVSGCTFLAFTKKFDLVNKYLETFGPLPDNLRIIFSGWGSALRPVNPHGLPESDIIQKGEKMPDDCLKLCGGNCADCICRGVACWDLKPGEKIYFIEH